MFTKVLFIHYILKYSRHRDFIGCKWYGFNDPQSGISHYVWRVGTRKGSDDIIPATEVFTHEQAFIFDIYSEYGFYLPTNGTRMFCTIRAYNQAGI